MADARNHPLYRVYWGMRTRCYNPSSKDACIYGNLPVCDRWLEPRKGFWNFVADMGERPEGCTLDRKDNTKGYSPENCRWATTSGQTRNRRAYGEVKQKWVTRHSGTGNYQARWRHSETRKLHCCGTFKTPHEAHLAACAHRLENYWRI